MLNEHARVYALLLVAFALRVYRLDAQALWWDESLSVYRATRALGAVLANTILIQNVVTVDTLPQLYFVLLNLFVRAVGISEFALRFFSVAANVATIPLVYALARRWFSPPIAWLAAGLATLSPFYIWYAQEARPYALVLFFSTFAVYALTRTFQVSSFRFQISYWIVIYVLASIASLYTHYYAIFLLPFHAILIAVLIWQRASWRERVWILLPGLPLTSIILLLPQIHASAAGNVATGPYFVPLEIMLRDLLNSFSVGVTMDLGDALWIDSVMLLLFILGIALVNPKSQNANLKIGILLLAYLLVPTAAVFFLSYFRPLYQNSRYLIAISPAFYFGVAAGIVALASRWKLVALAAGLPFVVGAMLSLNHLYFDARFGKDDHRAWSALLRERARPGDFLILNSPHAETLYRYYADDIVPMTTLPILRADGKPSPDADRAAVRAALQNERVWYLAMHVPFDDPQKRIASLLNQEGVLIDQVTFAGTSTEIALALFLRTLPMANASEIAHPVNVAFAGHLRLRGFEAPQTIDAGARGIVKLFWQIDEPVGEDYAVSLRLVDENGNRVEQWDAVPLGNRAGTSTWMPGKILIDARDVQGTTPGKYRLQVVPYHAATGNPLGDIITLGEIQIR